MNEHFWFREKNPLALLSELYPPRTLGSVQPQTRQSRLYLVACARRQWERLPAVCRALVERAEAYADAGADADGLREQLAPVAFDLMESDGEPQDLRAAYAELVERGHAPPADDRTDAPPESVAGWRELAALVYLPFEAGTPAYTWVPRRLHSARLLREVYGYPFHRVHFSAEWRTSTAVALATQMYASREFSAMPILADALQDAGCDNADVLAHLRGADPRHVRGCWVLDLVLARK